MKKKVGIITLNGYINHGNRLQNFALEHHLINCGYDVETIRVNIEERNSLYKLKSLTLKELIFKVMKKISKQPKKKNTNIESIVYNPKRIENFKLFSDNYLHETIDIYDNKSIQAIKENYDALIVGSDQVWAPCYIQSSTINLLEFTKSSKKISYAASFGNDNIPEYLNKRYISGLMQFDFISVREKSGQQFVELLTHKKIELVLDPTFLLSKEKWMEIIQNNNYAKKEHYIFMYFLGELDEEYANFIQQCAKKKECKIINIMDSGCEECVADPFRFLNLLSNAELVCTDSFHGTVFSIIFNCPFIVFQRKDSHSSMMTRFETLLGTFDLENRIYKNIANENVFLVDFDKANKTLDIEREKSKAFLREALQ